MASTRKNLRDFIPNELLEQVDRVYKHFPEDIRIKLAELSPNRRLRIITRLMLRVTDISVAFEDIHDPHNVLAAMRSVDAFGLQYVDLIFNEQNQFNPYKVGKKTSASANKWLSVSLYNNLDRAIERYRKVGLNIVATVIDKDAVSINDVNWNKLRPFVIGFGNEHRGLSGTFIEAADLKVYIPMYGFVESLNLSVSVGVFLFSITTSINRDFEITNEKIVVLKQWLGI